MKSILLSLVLCLSVHAQAQTQDQPQVSPNSGPAEFNSFARDTAPTAEDFAPSVLDELDPTDPRTQSLLEQYDSIYEQETGQSAYLDQTLELFSTAPKCSRSSCSLWAEVVKKTQRLNLYEGGKLIASWKTSTGRAGHTTPNFDRNPDGRIFNHHSSGKYPGGDYKGLGNMPYAVFIQGGFAIHGTPAGNWSKLGSVASHGCIRIHPDNALVFNQMVRHYGIANTWITVR